MSRKGIELTLTQVQAHQRKHGFMATPASSDTSHVRIAENGQTGLGGQIRKPKRLPKGPNRTESEYGLILKAKFPQSNVRFEAYTLKLADGCRYSPDWSVEHPDRTLEFHEVKGPFIYSKALTKPRTAAELFPQRFTLAQKLKSGWEITPLRGKADRLPVAQKQENSPAD